MKQEQIFMMIFRFTPDFNYQPSEAELAEMHQQWGTFIGKIALSEKLVSTHRLGFEGKSITADSQVTDGICIADAKTVSGNMVIRANSLEEAAEIAKDCPILRMGGTVEVRNILPMES